MYGFQLLLYRNNVPKMHRFLRYSTSKMSWLWKLG